MPKKKKRVEEFFFLDENPKDKLVYEKASIKPVGPAKPKPKSNITVWEWLLHKKLKKDR